MADSKITALSDGGAIQAADELVVARSGTNNKIAGQRVMVNVGSSPPSSPQDGDVWIFPADATNGVYWQFVYVSSQATYKWVFVGGPPMTASVGTDESSTTTSAWLNLATDGPSVTPGRGGDYTVFAQAAAYGLTSNVSYIGVAINDGTPGQNSSLSTLAATAAAIPGYTTAVTGVGSTDKLKLRYYKTNTGTGHWLGRAIFVWPIRVI